MNRIHILHVVGRMNRAGVETWLLNLLRRIDRSVFKMDFLVHTDQPGEYDEEVRDLGSRLLLCLHPRVPVVYARNFRQILRQYGPFDVVHSHVDHYSGFPLWLARQAGVRKRVCHSHTDSRPLQRQSSPLRRAYFRWMNHWIQSSATDCLAVSRTAAAAMYGEDWEADPRCRVFRCGINLEPFRETVDSVAIRAELGIPADATVVGHVGRFHRQKNHRFLIEIAAELIRRDPRFHFLLVGDGPLRKVIEGQVAALGLHSHFTLTGSRPQVPRLLLGAMDVFLFPSVMEGLGLALVEAQVAGLPCITSTGVPDEADAVPSLITRLSLSTAPKVWADAVLSASAALKNREVRITAAGQFRVEEGLRVLRRIYG